MTPMLFMAAAAGELAAQIATTIVTFFLVLLALYKLAWGPVLNLLDERRKTIADQFDSIEKQQSELESKLKDYEERLRQIDGEARERMNKAIEEGRKAANDILEDSRKEAETLRARAAADIQTELEKARIQLRNEVVSLTIRSTEKLMKAEMNGERQRALVGSFIDELAGQKAP